MNHRVPTGQFKFNSMMHQRKKTCAATIFLASVYESLFPKNRYAVANKNCLLLLRTFWQNSLCRGNCDHVILKGETVSVTQLYEVFKNKRSMPQINHRSGCNNERLQVSFFKGFAITDFLRYFMNCTVMHFRSFSVHFSHSSVSER